MTRRITVLALENCLASAVTGPLDVLHTANLVASRMSVPKQPLFEWRVASIDGQAVRASNGCRLHADVGLSACQLSEIIVLPGIGSPDVQDLRDALNGAGPVLAWLRAQYQEGVTLAANCSSTFLLAEAGLLDGKPATTTWWLAPFFEQRYPAVHLQPDSMLTESGRLICAGAAMSHLDLALYLIERSAGADLAHVCAKYMVLDTPRRSQAPYMIPNHIRASDPLIVEATKWVRAHMRETISVEDIARHVCVSPRTLDRRFARSVGESPLRYLQRQRIEASKALLASTNRRIDDIRSAVGYADPGAFRRLFKRHTGLSPREYRERFGAAHGRS